MEKRKKRSKNFFMLILLMLVVKILVSKIDIFGVNAVGTGFFDILVIGIAAFIISSLPTKERLLAYSLFSFTLGVIILVFKSRVLPFNRMLSPLSIFYFLDSIFIFSIYMLVRTEKKRKKEIVPKHPKMVYVLLMVFGVMSVINIVSVKASALDASEKAKKLGIFAYSISNPTMYIKADTITPTPVDPNAPIDPNATIAPLPTDAITPTPTPAEPLVKYNGLVKGKNIIMIQWEALQDLPVNRKLNGIEITPNLNKLIKESAYFKNGVAQISKGTTSDAEFAVSTSCYPAQNAAAFETMADRKYVGLPYLMKKAGYYTSTFHTNTATFWNRTKMYPLLGWNKWYDKPFFGNDYVVGFGAADYVLYQKAIPELVKYKKTGKPFFSQLITVSSHNPFTIPSWMKTVHFGADIDNTVVGRYFRTVNYADRQLGMFIADLKKNGLYDDSLIVLYGDHFGLSQSKMIKEGQKTNLAIVKKVLGRTYDKFDTLNIPILFKLPGGEGAQTITMPAGQVDIMPTILNLVGAVNTEGKMFGSDLMNITENQVGVRFYAPTGSYANNTQFFVGKDYAINYSHKTAKVTTANPEMQALYLKIAASDAYVKGLKRLK